MSATAMSPPADMGMETEVKVEHDAKPALTPPTSEGTNKKDDDSGSELSDLEPESDGPAPEPKEADNTEIHPDHYWEGGHIPVFKPVSLVRVHDRHLYRKSSKDKY